MPHSADSFRLLPEQAKSITRLLADAQQTGEEVAWNHIYALLYDDLRRIARSQIRKVRRTSQVSPTSLVSEAWLRLAQTNVPVESRAHLVSLIARAMRFTLLDCVRQQLSEKHGHRIDWMPLETAAEHTVSDDPLERLLSLDQAMTELAELDERLVKVVELRYFGGLNEQEIAAISGVTERTVRRDWRRARAFLAMHLGENTHSMEQGGHAANLP